MWLCRLTAKLPFLAQDCRHRHPWGTEAIRGISGHQFRRGTTGENDPKATFVIQSIECSSGGRIHDPCIGHNDVGGRIPIAILVKSGIKAVAISDVWEYDLRGSEFHLPGG